MPIEVRIDEEMEIFSWPRDSRLDSARRPGWNEWLRCIFFMLYSVYSLRERAGILSEWQAVISTIVSRFVNQIVKWEWGFRLVYLRRLRTPSGKKLIPTGLKKDVALCKTWPQFMAHFLVEISGSPWGVSQSCDSMLIDAKGAAFQMTLCLFEWGRHTYHMWSCLLHMPYHHVAFAALSQ